MTSKPTNPKDAVGGGKLPMHLGPAAIQVLASLSFLEGALKYGKFNWRVAGVRMSIYLDAMKRHIAKLENGEWADKKTKVPHLGSIIACCGIIEDARLCEKLTDDRPPPAPYSDYIDGWEPVVAHLKELFKDYNPKQYTINDHKQETPGTSTEAARPKPRNRRDTQRKGVRARRKPTRSR